MLAARASNFFKWWKDELLSFVPDRVLNFLTPDQSLVLFAAREGRLNLQYFRSGEPVGHRELILNDRAVGDLREDLRQALDAFAAKNPKFALDMPEEWLLTRSLSLPAAAAGDVRQAMRYEIERRTPFSPNEVYYQVQTLSDPEDDSQIDVSLRIVPREPVDESIEALSSLGVRPDRVGFAKEGLSAAGGFNVLPPDQKGSGLGRNTLVTSGLGLLAIILLSGAVWVSLVNKKERAAALLEETSLLRTEITEAARLESEIDRLVKQYRFIREKRRRHTPTVAVLDELTKLLPDDTWLRNMRVIDGKVTISGEASQASALVGLVEDSPNFQNVSMPSPVRRNQKTNKDSFRLVFDLKAKGR